MKNVVLTGFMGSGKTTAGKLAAEELRFRFIDADSYLEKKYGMRIVEIFEKFGEGYFRSLETECISELSCITDCVIATGGGAVLNKDNIEMLRKNGIIFYLDAPFDDIIKHTTGSNDRPLLSGKPLSEIKERYLARRPYYENCDYKIKTDGLTPLQIAQKVVSLYKKSK